MPTNNEPAVVNDLQNGYISEIARLQAKVKKFQHLHEKAVKTPHIFFSSNAGEFVELQQSDFHFDLSSKVAEMIIESLLHYQKQLEATQLLHTKYLLNLKN